MWTESTDNLFGSGVSAYQWRVDDQEWSVWQDDLSATVGVQIEGNRVFYVRAKDNAGNVGAEESLSFVIDLTGPGIVDATLLGELAANLGYLDITFSEPINEESLKTIKQGKFFAAMVVIPFKLCICKRLQDEQFSGASQFYLASRRRHP